MRDIKELLPIAAQRGEHKRDAGWLSPYFLSMAEDRVQRFMSEGDAGLGTKVVLGWPGRKLVSR